MSEEEVKELERAGDESFALFLAGEERAKRIERLRYRIQKPKGLFFKKCPKCGERLVTQEYYSCRYYKCHCGYEYATKIGRIKNEKNKKANRFSRGNERAEGEGFSGTKQITFRLEEGFASAYLQRCGKKY